MTTTAFIHENGVLGFLNQNPLHPYKAINDYVQHFVSGTTKTVSTICGAEPTNCLDESRYTDFSLTIDNEKYSFESIGYLPGKQWVLKTKGHAIVGGSAVSDA